MSEPAEINSRWKRFQDKAIKTATEWLAVFIATWGFFFGVVGCIIGCISWYAANDAKEKADTMEIYVNNLNAYLKAKGLELPEE